MANYHKGLWLFLGISQMPIFLLSIWKEIWFTTILSLCIGVWTLGQLFDRKEPLPKVEYEITDPNKKKTEVVKK